MLLLLTVSLVSPTLLRHTPSLLRNNPKYRVFGAVKKRLQHVLFVSTMFSIWDNWDKPINFFRITEPNHNVSFGIKKCICHFVKWHIHTFIYKIHIYKILWKMAKIKSYLSKKLANNPSPRLTLRPTVKLSINLGKYIISAKATVDMCGLTMKRLIIKQRPIDHWLRINKKQENWS